MAFVPIVGLRPDTTPLNSTVSSFSGNRLTAPTVCPSNAPVARLGTVLGNSSLDKLGLERFSNERFQVSDRARPAGFSADYEEIISGCYRQVFGNAYIMESERAELAKAESEFRDQRLSLKEFIRCIAKSYQYKKRFFDSRPLYGAIELNFKHFLGRTPDGLEEYRAKSAIYDTKGYESFVDAFFDDGEYDLAFDEWCVPFYRGHLTTANLSMCAFTHLFQVVRGASTSDKSNPRTMTNRIPLNRAGIQSIALPVIPPGSGGSSFLAPGTISGSWQNGVSGATMARTYHGTRQEGGKMFRIEVADLTQRGANNGRAGINLRSRTGRVYKTQGLSDFRRSSSVFLVPFNELSQTYVRIHKDGGKIASITPV